MIYVDRVLKAPVLLTKISTSNVAQPEKAVATDAEKTEAVAETEAVVEEKGKKKK